MNRKAGISDALPSEEVLRSLNINVLHQSLSQFGITEVLPEVCGCLEYFVKKCQHVNSVAWGPSPTRPGDESCLLCYLRIKISRRVRIL